MATRQQGTQDNIAEILHLGELLAEAELRARGRQRELVQALTIREVDNSKQRYLFNKELTLSC
jgi:hypothetical protein